jgi:uncharacterized protein (DUF433 family)
MRRSDDGVDRLSQNGLINNGLWVPQYGGSFFVASLSQCLRTPSPFRLARYPLKDYDLLLMVATNRIVLDPAIHHGKPIIRGTRVPVTVVVGSLAGGMTFEEIQREYDLSADDIRAALKFVADLADQESFHPLPAT